jgi:alkylation response protein AidB-like acyl-CoA dehydrogenase
MQIQKTSLATSGQVHRAGLGTVEACQKEIGMFTPSDTELIQSFADSARVWLSERSPLSRWRASYAGPRLDPTLWRDMAQMGWFSITVPQAQGGLGLGLDCLGTVLREVGRHPVTEPVLHGALHPLHLLLSLPPHARRDTLVQSLMRGDLISGVAWQERPGELAPHTLETVLDTSSGQGVLDGHKSWVLAEGVQGWLVLARSQAGQALCWVAADAPGVSVTPKKKVDGTRFADLHFQQVKVAPDDILLDGTMVLSALAQANDVLRILQGHVLLGAAEAAHEMTLAYTKTRVQFGKTVASNQAIQFRAVDNYLAVQLAQAAITGGLTDLSPETLSSSASRIKARCTTVALSVCREAIQLHGAIGYTDEYDVGLYLRKALTEASILGGDEAHRMRYLQLQSAGNTAPDEVNADVPTPLPDDLNELSDGAFRAVLRQFLQEHYPAHRRHPTRRLHWNEIQDWYFSLARKGWLAPAWPKAYGGMGLSAEKQLAYIEELEAYGAARLPDQGVINLGPILIKYGTEAQRQQYLPPILRGEHIWCQGYSEPNAGSDLASLRTQAVREGDVFVVNGQKIWTTLAMDATHIFLLVRTDNTVKKQAGISFLLVDMATPGVTVRPIRNIADEEEFCEVFFDNVRVPVDNLVGEINQGWTIAKALLGFERIFVGSPKTPSYALEQLRQLAAHRGLFEDAAFCSRYARLLLDVEDLVAMYGHFAAMVKEGKPLPPSVSILKVWATETYSRISLELAMTAEEDGGSREFMSLGDKQLDPLACLMNATITTIYAGTNEIQRGILAKHTLDMPS